MQRRFLTINYCVLLLKIIIILIQVTNGQVDDNNNNLRCSGNNYFQIEDDEWMNTVVSNVRARYLASRPTQFNTLDVTILIPTSKENTTEVVWKRGSYNPFQLSYPASCVKLGYMIAAVQWCLSRNRAADCLDSHVRPMVKDSDNVQTGIVVDICSGAPNLNLSSVNDPLFPAWYQKRLWTETFLSSHSLLSNQTISVKTYPTNTGQNLWGAEYTAWNEYGRNQMNPICSANIMLSIMTSSLFPPSAQSLIGPNEYMKQLLNHQRYSSESSIGFGVPPGSLLLNKIGVAYDNLNDIAFVELPNGRQFVLAVFSDGYEPTQPAPYDGSNLGTFTEMLIDELQLTVDNPIVIKKTINEDESVNIVGDWSHASSNDAYLKNYLYTSSTNNSESSVNWSIDIPKSSLYEIAIWSPQSSSFSQTTQVTVQSYVSTNLISLPQQNLGGRWVKLGEFYLLKGLNKNLVSVSGSNDGVTVANAIKVTLWPECRHSPGALCSDFQQS